MFRPVIISLLALIILAFEANAGESADHCKDALPKNLQGAIAAKYNGWRVVHDGDLSTDDLKIWKRLFPNHCPGVVKAAFEKSGTPQYAVLLNSKAEKKTVLLVAKETKLGNFRLIKIDEFTRGNSPVIHAGKPGTYFNISDRSKAIKVPRPTIVLEVLEASAVAYFYNGTRFQSVVISDG